MAKSFFPAEWYPQSAVQLTWPHAGTDWASTLADVVPCFVQVAQAISHRQRLIIICHNIDAVREQIKGCKLENIRLHTLPTNDTWARDHSGLVAFEKGKPMLLDFCFNGWGLKFAAHHDNLLVRRMYQQDLFSKNLEYCNMQQMVLEGGAIESDGEGTLLTTADCLLSPNRNDHMHKAAIEAVLKRVFYLKRVLWLHHGYLEGDDTDSHIDTLARFCDAQTIAYVRCEDSTDVHYEALQKMEGELKQFRTLQDKAYRLVPLPMADAVYDDDGHRLPATYANFLIINGAVLLPTYGNPAQDRAAADALGSAFPQRRVIGINCEPLIRQHGSLHCITMQYPEGVVR